jgi:hypothetical protein
VHSQAPASCPHPEQDQSSLCFPIPLLEDTLNIILPSTPWSSQQCHSMRSPRQNLVCTSPVPHTCHMPHPTHSVLYDHPNNSEEYTALSSSLYSSPLPWYLVPLRAKYLLQHPILKHTQLLFLSQCKTQASHPCRTKGEIAVLYTIIFIFLIGTLGDKRFCIKW